jgi:hypothetical protein
MNYHDFDVFHSLCSGNKYRLVLQGSCLVSHMDILHFYCCILRFPMEERDGGSFKRAFSLRVSMEYHMINQSRPVLFPVGQISDPWMR